MYWTLGFRLFIHNTNAPQKEKDNHELWKIKHILKNINNFFLEK